MSIRLRGAATTNSVSCVLLCAPFPMTLLSSLCMPSPLAELITVAQSLLGLIGRLDRVLRSAAHLIGHIPKYASVSAYMRDVLHWLPVSLCILYRISALVWRSVTGCAPSYLTDLCRPVSDLASHRALRSSARGELLVPRARSALKQRRAFSVIGPSIWNQIPLTLHLLPRNNESHFCKLLRTFLFDRSWTESASE